MEEKLVRVNLGVIYMLVDPRDSVVRYVGQTIQETKQRLAEHISLARRKKIKNIHVYNWIRQLLNLNLVPEIYILEDNLDNAIITDREKYWINHLKNLGADLTNKNLDPHEVHNKGQHHSEKTKQKIRAKRALQVSPMKGMHHSEDSKRKMSKAKEGYVPWMKGKTHSKESREAISKIQKGRKRSDETKRRQSDGVRKYWESRKARENQSG